MGHVAMTPEKRRRVLSVTWVLFAAVSLGIFVFRRDLVERALGGASDASLWIAALVYLVLGCFRGFTFVPVTSLVVLGLVVLPPLVLFPLTLVGILVSSASVYSFAEALALDELLERRHGPKLERVRGLLERHGVAVVVGWSFFPLVPTDLVCYLAGVVRMPLVKLLVGVALGEGAICAVYVFGGDALFAALGWR